MSMLAVKGFCSGWFEDVLSILSGKNKETELEDRRSRRIPTQSGLKTSQDIPRPLESRGSHRAVKTQRVAEDIYRALCTSKALSTRDSEISPRGAV